MVYWQLPQNNILQDRNCIHLENKASVQGNVTAE